MDKHEYYLGIAEAVSKKSTCLKKQWGAVVVKNNEIISTGYNGAPRKIRDCVERGYCLRDKATPGTDYSNCLAIHAEMNALLSAARKDLIDADLYLVGLENNTYVANPGCCKLCKRFIKNAGIKRIIMKDEIEYPEEWDKPEEFIGGY